MNPYYLHPATARALLAESRERRAKKLAERAIAKAAEWDSLEMWPASNGVHLVAVTDRVTQQVGVLWIGGVK
jgi:hypothetical protein